MAGGQWLLPSANTIAAVLALLFVLGALPNIVHSLGGDLGLLRNYIPWCVALVVLAYVLQPSQQ